MTFSTKRLLASTFLIALGCGLMMAAWRLVQSGPFWPTTFALAMHMAGSMIVGAGFGNIVKRPVVGLIYGVALGLIALILMPHRH
jgi:hypothetical protein